MKKTVLTLATIMAFGWQGISFADSSVDALIQKLQDKGILTSQEASQLKDEVSTKEETTQKATFKSMLPSWISGIKIGGDFRLRDQIQRTKKPTGGTGNDARNRGRLRARLNLEDQINDKVKFDVTLATEGGSDNGQLNNSRSNNWTFGGNGSTGSGSFSKPYIALDKAYVTYTPNKMVTLLGGKMANPIWEPASLLWDPDITPEGGAILLSKRLSDLVTPFSTNAFFVLKDSGPSSSQRTDPYVFVTQEGIKGNLTDKVFYQAAAQGHFFSNAGHVPLDNGAGSVGNTLTSGGLYAYGYSLVGGAINIGMNDPFGDMLPNPIYIPQIGIFGEYNQNMDVSNKNTSWDAGWYMGNSAINGWGTWKISSFYKVLAADSVPDAIPSDDFYSGDTDTRGWQNEIDIGLAKNVWFDMLYYHTNVYKPIASITNLSSNAPEDIFQIDMNFKF
ncbi:MAG: putative porin [Candidatus Omnitrophica bacterium]|nr:putative porin [Candidatus Omnitrophota bacterium]MDE2221821.1 putative porin [Candidatus Omnitrophota bacterium]